MRQGRITKLGHRSQAKTDARWLKKHHSISGIIGGLLVFNGNIQDYDPPFSYTVNELDQPTDDVTHKTLAYAPAARSLPSA